MWKLELTAKDRREIEEQAEKDDGCSNTLLSILLDHCTEWEWEGGDTITLNCDRGTAEAIYLFGQDEFNRPFQGYSSSLQAKLLDLYDSGE